MLDTILEASDSIRYVAIYRSGHLEMKSKAGRLGASEFESDKYEELLVNPTMLKLATQRGNIDCGGLKFLLVRYGNFFQYVQPTSWGHVSVCIEPNANPIEISSLIQPLIDE